ncbi:uncharacterized protein EI90DRAFT_397534 [Cantharellus anzutake]|uniref:uncharacterized protein n=1 Tax=Cantharellus anzutake TaxID=1750568 RepID=UPI0019059CC2|nr:uncharacterized protein EI90DRAFT_397534 [Cantharellus anzutake]KAF8335072.1 hypothetical protein EI90DRAFT_397534 [Cantharellus anzutake]
MTRWIVKFLQGSLPVPAPPSPRNEPAPLLQVESDDGLRAPLSVSGIYGEPSSDEKLVPPIRPFVYDHVDSSGSSTSSSRSSRSSLTSPTAQQHLYSTIIYSIQASVVPSPHPLLYSPSEPIFPRSCVPFDSPPPAQPTLRHQLLRARLLKRIETYVLTPAEEHSIRPFVQRPPRSLRSQIPFSENEARHTVDSGGWSRGLNRWIRRGGFEERNVIWVPNDDQTRLYMEAITGGPIAALEFSEGLEALAGLQGDLLQSQTALCDTVQDSQETIPPQEGNIESTPPLQSSYRRSSSTPSTASSAHTSNTPNTPILPVTPPLPAVKRGVRFAPSIDSSDSISETNGPLVIVHPSSPSNELEIETPRAVRAQNLSPSAEARKIREQALQRQRLEYERARELARRQEMEEQDRIRQRNKEEDARKKAALHEKVVATRIRRESYKLDGGSSSTRALLSEKGLLNKDPFAPPITPKHNPRRSSTDPGKADKHASWSSVHLPNSSIEPASAHRASAPIYSSPLRPQSSSTSALPNTSRSRRISSVSNGVDKRPFLNPHEPWRLSQGSTSGYSDDYRSSWRSSLTPSQINELGQSISHAPLTGSRSKHDAGSSEDVHSIRSLPRSSRLSISNVVQLNAASVPPVPHSSFPPTSPYGMTTNMGMPTPMVIMQPVFMLPPPNANGGFPWMQSSGSRSGSLTSIPTTPTPGAPGTPDSFGSSRQSNPGRNTSPASASAEPSPPQRGRRERPVTTATPSSSSRHLPKGNGSPPKAAPTAQVAAQPRTRKKTDKDLHARTS